MPAEIELPRWLLDRIAAEGQTVDLVDAARRIKSAGGLAIELRQRPERLDQIHVTGPGLDIGIDIDPAGGAYPVTDALARLTERVAQFGALRRIHSAWIDMMHVSEAAAYLANYAHRETGTEIPPISPTVAFDAITEAGVAVMYARPYTGNARLGNRWAPQGAEDRALHGHLVNERNTTYAHYDWSDSRSLVDNNVVLGLQGAPVILVEVRTRMSHELLIQVADLAQRQSLRFYAEASNLKKLVGAANF